MRKTTSFLISMIGAIAFAAAEAPSADYAGVDPLAGARIVATGQTAPDAKGSFRRTKVLEIHASAPLIRVEERVEQQVSAAGVRTETRTSTAEMAADRVLVKLKPGRDRKALEAVIKQFNGRVSRVLPGSHLHIVAFDGRQIDALDRALNALRSRLDVVEYAEPDGVFRIDYWPNDPYYSICIFGHPETCQWGSIRIDAYTAWDYATGSASIVVGVLDTGMSYTHPDLASNVWVNTDEIPNNGVDDDHNGYVDDVVGYDFVDEWAAEGLIDPRGNDPNDRNGHGSLVAGIIGAVGNNGIGVVGVCWRVSLMPLQVATYQGFVFESAAIEGIDYAISNGVNVLNASWSSFSACQPLRDAIARANAAGILFVASAGNDSTNIDLTPKYPACFDCPNILSVCASDYLDALPAFSNYGTNNVDLAAPGACIVSTYSSGSYASGSGCSFAVPHVAGAAALLWSSRPHLRTTPTLMKSLILDTARPVAGLVGKAATAGVLDVGTAMGSDYFVEIRAKGTKAGGVWPQMQLWLGNQLWAQWTVASNGYETYSAIVRPADLAGQRSFTVVFTNGGSGRVLYVDSILMDGVLEEAEAPDVVYDRGNAFDNVDLVPGTETLDQTGGLRVPLLPTVYVDDSNTSGIEDGTAAHPFNTIQEGVNASGAGYVVSVAPGNYTESVVISSPNNLTVLGSGANTIVSNATDYKFQVFYGGGVTVEGFCIRGGQEGFYVYGVSNVTVRNCLIENLSQDNYAYNPGAAFYGTHSSLRIEGNSVSNCYGGQYGGVGYFVACDMTVISNRFINCTAWNSGGGFYLSTYDFMTPRTVRFVGNFFDQNLADYSGAIDLVGNGCVDMQIDHNIIRRSGADYFQYGGAIRLRNGNTNSYVKIINNVIAAVYNNYYNYPVAVRAGGFHRTYAVNNIFDDNDYTIYADYSEKTTAEYNDSFNSRYGYANVVLGVGGISADPLFVTPVTDYHLQAGSPCINAGNPDPQYNDKDGTRNDMGAFGGPLN